MGERAEVAEGDMEALDEAEDPPPGGPEGYKCWVCERVYPLGNMLQAHYAEEHAVCDPELVTTKVHTCPRCQQHFPTIPKRDMHDCPLHRPLQRINKVDRDGDPPYPPSGEGQHPPCRHVSTDGSGGQENRAGWAVVIYDEPPRRPVAPDYVLYGPVITEAWDPNFLGATAGTNNTGELTAIGEACAWLWDMREERSTEGQPVRAVIHYDSEYARDLAVRVATPQSNRELAERVAALVDRVRSVRPLDFRHVKGHSGDVGNDSADLYANRGRMGRVSPQWRRWTDVPEAWEEVQTRDTDMIETCRHCGRQFDTAYQRGAHEGRCRVAGVAPPPGMARCRKCGEMLKQRTLKTHEPLCRGTREANLVCAQCGEEFPDFRLLRVHEFDCTRLAERRAAKAAAPPPPPPVAAMREDEAAQGQCFKCGMRCGRNLTQHSQRCRGSEIANRTCVKCGRVYASWDSCRSHEKRCRV